MTLLQRLTEANYQTTAIIPAPGCSFPQLLARARQLRLQHPSWQDKVIALHFTDLATFSVALLAFDGWCRQLYLLADSAMPLPDEILHYPQQDGTASDNTAPTHLITASQSTATDTRWMLATSGTTGSPKWIGHTVASLTRAVKVNAAGPAQRWALCYQPSRFAGLQVVLQSLLSGAGMVDCSRGDAQQRIALMQQGAVNAASATPSLWRQLLMTGELSTLPLQQITLGGEIADQALLDSLAQQFPQARLLHIYASTEAGVGFAVADKQAGFPASWLHQGHSGLSFKIDSRQHLWLKPPIQPDRSLTERLDQEGFIDTEDLVTVSGQRVVFLGRANGVINVGGNKVHPEQVEQVLLQHSAVVQARVYAKHSSVLGQLVVADVQAAADADLKTLKLQLIQHCMKSLARYQVPTQLNFVDNMATNASGKLSRQLKDKIQHD